MVDMGLQVDRLLVVELAHDVDGRLAGGDARRFVAVSVDDVVDAAVVAVDGLAVADREAHQVLQLDGHVLDHVAGIGAVGDPLKEAARFADRTAVIVDRRNQRPKGVSDPGDLVAWTVLEIVDVQPHVDRLVAAEIVGAAQRTVLKYMQS